MQIEGLVSAVRRVREALRRGIAEDEQEEFREYVRFVLLQVEEICERHGRSPEDLPGPSRKAWRFLRDLDLSRLPEPSPGAPPPGRRIRIRGVLAEAERLAGILWAGRDLLPDDDATAEGLRARAESLADGVREVAEELASTPAALPARSRAAYALLRWFSIPGNVVRYARALAAAETAARLAMEGPFEVRIFPASSAWSVRRRPGSDLVMLHPAFLAADEVAWAALREVLRPGSSRKAATFLRKMIREGRAAAVLAEFDMALS